MEFDLSLVAFGLHAAIGGLFFVLAAFNLLGGQLVPAALQGGIGVMLVVLGVAVGRILRRRE